MIDKENLVLILVCFRTTGMAELGVRLFLGEMCVCERTNSASGQVWDNRYQSQSIMILVLGGGFVPPIGVKGTMVQRGD